MLEQLHLAAKMEVLCSFKGNLIEATFRLLASYFFFHVQLSPFLKSDCLDICQNTLSSLLLHILKQISAFMRNHNAQITCILICK